MTRVDFDTGRGAGPTSLPGELERDTVFWGSSGPAAWGGEVAEGGSAGPATLRRLSLVSGLQERPRSLSMRLRFVACEGIEGPIEGISSSWVERRERGERSEMSEREGSGAVTKSIVDRVSARRASSGPPLPISELRPD